MPPSTFTNQSTDTTQPVDYSKATLNPQFQEKAPQISQTIQQLRSQKVPDEKIFSYLQQKGVIQMPKPPAPTPTPVTQRPSFTGLDNPSTTMSGSTQAVPNNSTPNTGTILANTGKALVTGTIESGKDIGAAISAPVVQKAFNGIDKADQEGMASILKLRQQAAAKGQNTTHFDNLIKNYQLSNNQTVADIFPELKKSDEQVIGDFAGMALEAISAGSGLSSASEKVAGTTAKGLPLAQRVLKGAAIGGGYGAGFGATGAMQNNESPTGIAKSTLIGAGTGTAIGGATAGIFGKRPIDEPTITVGGKTLTLDDVHSDTDFVKSLSPEDQKAVSNFDQHYSLIKQVDGMKAQGQDTSDFKDEYNKRVNSSPEIPEGSNATLKVPKDPNAKEISKIQDTIAPKLNKNETQAAIDEGRVTRGKNSFLFGKQPDTVIPSDEVVQASKTIQSNIPGAAKMNDAELTNAINDHIGMTSQNLAEDMKNVPVKDETLSKVTDVWQKLKAEQSSSPEFLDNESGNKAFQGKFENYLKSAQDANDLNDVWEARKSYDDSIPRNVKQATEASSPILQTRKAMWLDNRGILNSMIHDTANGLGDESRQAFSEMSDMYSAKQNILSKAKIDAKGVAGGNKIIGFIKSHPKTSAAIGTAVGLESLKKATGL